MAVNSGYNGQVTEHIGDWTEQEKYSFDSSEYSEEQGKAITTKLFDLNLKIKF